MGIEKLIWQHLFWKYPTFKYKNNFRNNFLISDKDNELFNQFLKANSTDEQLTLLKKILEAFKDDNNSEKTIQFLVVTFFHADARHPVKCFLMR